MSNILNNTLQTVNIITTDIDLTEENKIDAVKNSLLLETKQIPMEPGMPLIDEHIYLHVADNNGYIHKVSYKRNYFPAEISIETPVRQIEPLTVMSMDSKPVIPAVVIPEDAENTGDEEYTDIYKTHIIYNGINKYTHKIHAYFMGGPDIMHKCYIDIKNVPYELINNFDVYVVNGKNLSVIPDGERLSISYNTEEHAYLCIFIKGFTYKGIVYDDYFDVIKFDTIPDSNMTYILTDVNKVKLSEDDPKAVVKVTAEMNNNRCMWWIDTEKTTYDINYMTVDYDTLTIKYKNIDFGKATSKEFKVALINEYDSRTELIIILNKIV